MTKTTKKSAASYVTQTTFCAISFNADGSRATHYGGGNPLMILHFITAEAKKGLRALVFPAGFKYRDVYRSDLGVLECSSASMTDPSFYETVLPFAISTEDFSY